MPRVNGSRQWQSDWGTGFAKQHDNCKFSTGTSTMV